jgi:RNA-directed DNA polymerase
LSLPILSPHIQRIAQEAKADPNRVFTNLAHLIDEELLKAAFWRTRKDGAPGVDGVTGRRYEQHLEEDLRDLHRRLQEREYQAQPVRRVYIEKEGGKERALGVPAFEDKVVQRAVGMLLEAIYEQDFHPCSYGFRPGKSAHQALHHLREEGMQGWLNWIVDADIQGFFDQLDQGVLRDLLHRRVKDGGIDRLIGKWLNAGVLEAGEPNGQDARLL